MFQADLNCPESLLSCFGSSIAAVEIAQRGTEVEVGSNLLDKVNSQSLTHLKVLSETITSYLAVGALTDHGDNVMMSGFMRERDAQLQRLFFAHPRLYPHYNGLPQSKPFIENDAFLELATFTLCSIPRQRLDTKSMIKIFYVAEIVRVVLSYYRLCRSELFEQALANRSDGIEIPNLATFAMQVLGIDVIYPPLLSRLVIAYALPFLRKCTILMHVRYGIDFPSNIPAASDDSDELGRLTQLLQLPDIPMLLTDAMASSTLQDVVNGWVGHYMNFAGMDLRRKQPCPLSLSHPSIYELVGLPKNFDTLQDEVVRRKCPTTGRALSDPTLCLVCGEIFCSQGMCCTKTSKDGTSVGGCWQHRQK
jgi:E3 ubiquitin-protein ligase UBR1